MLPVLQVGPLAIQFPGLLLLAGIWFAILASEKAASRWDLAPERITNLIMTGLLAGLLGARLGYALRFLDLYLEQPLALFALDPNTLSGFEGLIAGVLAGLVYVQRKHLNMLVVLDALAPGLAVFMIALGLAHLASGDAFGAPSSLPWSIELWGARRHPSQVYEILASCMILLVILRLQKQRSTPGAHFVVLLALQSAARLFLEAFRGDSLILAGSLRAAQVVSLLLLVISILLLHRLSRNPSSSLEGRRSDHL
ncbi:MAG: prolipoprotein diacylglyceryl transferase [Anaerolineales bacterium]